MADMREQLNRSLGGQYDVERGLVAGGMSCVFLAREVRLARRLSRTGIRGQW